MWNKMVVAGFWKRLKNFLPKLLDVPGMVNTLYKAVQPIVDPILDTIPYGAIGKQVLHGVSKGVDVFDNVKNTIREKKTQQSNQGMFGAPLNQAQPLHSVQLAPLQRFQTQNRQPQMIQPFEQPDQFYDDFE